MDARLSFDVEGTIAKAKKILALYAEHVRRPSLAVYAVMNLVLCLQAAKLHREARRNAPHVERLQTRSCAATPWVRENEF